MNKSVKTLLRFTFLLVIPAALFYSCSLVGGREENPVSITGVEVDRTATINTGSHITLSQINNQWDIFSAPSTIGENFSDFFTVPAGSKVFIGDMQTCNGTDPSNVRFNTQYVNSDGNTYMYVRTKVEEDNHNGSEDDHSRSVVHGAKEVIAGIAMNIGPIRDAGGTTIGYSGSLDIDLDVPSGNKWNNISISNTIHFSDPVVFANVITNNGSEPCHVRIKDVGINGYGNCVFKLALEEWHRDNSDQAHTTETVNWVVLEKGTHYMGVNDIEPGQFHDWFYLHVDKFQVGLNYSGYGTYETINTGKPLLGNAAVILISIQTSSTSYPDRKSVV